jgi:hypothetical protein
MDGYEKKKYKPIIKKPTAIQGMNLGPTTSTILYQETDFLPEK